MGIHDGEGKTEKDLQQEWEKRYKDIGALWIYDGSAHRPHALLTSGMHSNGFFNSEIVMERPGLVKRACEDLISIATGLNFNPANVDRVVGPAMGAITLAHELAGTLGCLRAYVEKAEDSNGKSMRFDRTQITKGELVLLVEDVLTTGGSIERTAEAVTRTGAELLPYVFVLVNRSGLTSINGKAIISLVNHKTPIWEPGADTCPICKIGSEAIRPKGLENWNRLTSQKH